MLKMIKPILLVWVISCASILLWPMSVVSASNSELVKVTVNLTIENPDYFWKYPFSGKTIDRICISSMGERQYIESQSAGQKFEFNFPKDYQFTMRVELQSDNSIVNSLSFSKKGINETNNNLNVILKAPEAQPVIVHTQGVDETKINAR